MLYKYSSQLNGSLEDISVLDIMTAKHELRSCMHNLDELADSIKRIGLLQPIVVRTNSLDKFEVVAGNRRLTACKKLGWRKIACHVVELDDKTAFEVSIIENVQRHTLNPIEEGLAFKKYVNEFGWGGVTDLAEKLSKSTSYICKRIKLTELPADMIELISKSEISTSTGEELLPIVDKNVQLELVEFIRERQLSSRRVRKLVKNIVTKNLGKSSLYFTTGANEYETIPKTFDKVIISIRILIKKLATIIENVEDKWIFYDILMQHKHMLDQQIDLLIKEKRKYRKHSHILVRYQ
jgi:ParB family transcriptional regulator, chromosome partitioning protein